MTNEAEPTSEIWKSASCKWCRRPGLLLVSGIWPHSLAVITAKGLSSSTCCHCERTCECHSHTTAFPPSSVPQIRYCPVKSVLLRDLLSSISKFPLVGVSHLRKKPCAWCEVLTHWKRSWRCQSLKAQGKEGDRGWDGWITSPTQQTWIWANSGR